MGDQVRQQTSTPTPKHPILIVDDLKTTIALITGLLQKDGIDNVISCIDSRVAMDFFYSHDIEMVLLDLKMPYLDGESLLQKINQQFPEIPIIVVTGKTDIEVAVSCMKSGAFDFITKPIDGGRLLSAVSRAGEIRALKRENSALKKHILSETLENPEVFAEIITSNRKMKSIFQYIEAIAKTNHPVLITGETGVGKELIAKTLHTLSGLQGEMVPVNLAGVDDIVFSDTIFGHAKGAYTGAVQSRGGLIEKAAGGTIFLDEIGEIGKDSQIKLLRLIQEGEYYSLGSDVLKKSKARVITATNRELWSLEKEGAFRNDLIYRLQTHHIHIPPLRERKSDIPLLTKHFANHIAATLSKKTPALSNELFALLKSYPFMGNVRELQSMVYDAVTLHKEGELSLQPFLEYIQRRQAVNTANAEYQEPERSDLYADLAELPTLKDASRELIIEAINRTNGNQSSAAKILGITQPALNYRLKKESLRPMKQRHPSKPSSKL